MRDKPIISADQAARLIQDGWNITTGGFGSCGHPDTLTRALRKRFLEEQAPRDLTLVFAAGQGDKGSRGLNCLAQDGLLKRVIGGYWALTPALAQMASNAQIAAYNWPQGVISHLFRAIAGKKPGVVTPIGLGTFIDPRQEGGKLSDSCDEEMIQLVEIGGQEQLFYPAFPLQCALLRGTRADRYGNVTMEAEANFQDSLAQAQAVHNSGGVVIVQVMEVVEANSLLPHEVRIPGIFVDYLVKAADHDHWQTYAEKYNPTYSGMWTPTKRSPEPFELTTKKIIARRAYLEARAGRAGQIINLGIGTPEYIARVADEESTSDFALTIESGVIGGSPAGGLSFGASSNPAAILDQPSQFDFYDGGGIDIAFLGCGQVDTNGNVNISRLANRINGVGGFVNISQTSKKVVFCTPFTAGGLEIALRDSELRIAREGEIKKFVQRVEQVSFNAGYSKDKRREVMYITERAVFALREGSLVLTEVAPGIDVERDILAQSDARIHVSDNLKQMPSALFSERTMASTDPFAGFTS
jgi:propionate CoA-transferase